MKVYLIDRMENESDTLLTNLAYFTEGAYAFYFDEAEVAKTGDFNSVSELRNYLREADFILLMSEMDRRSYFELGLCQGLEKQVYILDESLAFDAKHLELALDLKIQPLDMTQFLEKIEKD